MKKILSIAAVAVLLAVAAGCGDNGEDASGDEGSGSGSAECEGVRSVKVVHLADLSGPTKTANEAQIRGMDLAVAELEEEGEVEIEIDRRDTGGDPARAIAMMREVDADEDVVLQLGPAQTPEFFAAIPVAEQMELPTYSFISGGVYTEDFNEWTWRSGFSDEQAIPPLIDYAVEELDAERAAVLFANDNDFAKFGADLYQSEGEDAGLEMVPQSFSSNDVKFDAQAREVAGDDVDVVFVSAVPQQAGFVIKALRDAGVEAPILASSNAVGSTQQVLENSGGEAAGVIVSSAIDFSQDRPLVTDYVASFEAEYPDVVPSFDAYAYDGIQVVADAVSKADCPLDRESIKAAMAEVDVEGLTSTRLTFPDGYGDAERESISILEMSPDGALEPMS